MLCCNLQEKLLQKGKKECSTHVKLRTNYLCYAFCDSLAHRPQLNVLAGFLFYLKNARFVVACSRFFSAVNSPPFLLNSLGRKFKRNLIVLEANFYQFFFAKNELILLSVISTNCPLLVHIHTRLYALIYIHTYVCV